MIFTELSQHRLPDGELTVWTPTAEVGSGAAWRDDDRPLTHLHEQYSHSNGSWLGAAFEVPFCFDPVALNRALTAWIQRHEVLRCTVAARPGADGTVEFSRRSLVAPFTCVPSVVDHVDTGPAAQSYLSTLFETALTPQHWPHCLIATIEPAAGAERFTVVFGADHSVMDAYSMALSIGEIEHFYREQMTGEPTGLAPTGSHVEFSTHERALGDAIVADDVTVAMWREFIADSGGTMPAFPMWSHEAALPDAGIGQTGQAYWLLSRDECTTISDFARTASGRGLQTAIIGALALTSRYLTGDPAFRFVMPMHTRHELQYANSVGWFVGIAPVSIDTSRSDSVAQVLTAAATACLNGKSIANQPFPCVARYLDGAPAPRFAVSFLEGRHIEESTQWPDWNARLLRGAATSADEVYLWFGRTPHGLSVSARYPAHPARAAAVELFLSTFNRILTALATLDAVDLAPAVGPRATAAHIARAAGDRQAGAVRSAVVRDRVGALAEGGARR
ncbi:condensation domain-containing protein [Williamsia sp. CHRR-6]|uniref:condensation domain-containing protein n=1 Tax=Williamsia sp. CHRR-6 TaxID=2835871 RepID=UPI001BDB031D|nr:condensation domain-containing protein [Williamsia sp. CHRR-6]MBT0566181.1 hypothetical protein [Williamsia sp. CHRR-6]